MRYRLRTLLILLAIWSPLVPGGGCNRERATQPYGFADEAYKVFRVPFPPEIKDALQNGERFVLYSIEGENGITPDVTEDNFHGFRILGKTDIETPDQRTSLLEALDKGIGEALGPALCFDPRHGMSVFQGDKRFDFIICFECFQIYVLDGGGKPVFKTQTSESPAAIFNATLENAGIRLATPPAVQS